MEGPPSRKRIAEYWCSEEALHELVMFPALLTDPEEPECQACGYYAVSWPNWNSSKLERAHILARSAGGSWDTSNFLLLCRSCHQEAPMTNDRNHMLQWAQTRPSHFSAEFDKLSIELSALGVDPEVLSGIGRHALLASARRLAAGTHFGRMSCATLALAVRGWIEGV